MTSVKINRFNIEKHFSTNESVKINWFMGEKYFFHSWISKKKRQITDSISVNVTDSDLESRIRSIEPKLIIIVSLNIHLNLSNLLLSESNWFNIICYWFLNILFLVYVLWIFSNFFIHRFTYFKWNNF